MKISGAERQFAQSKNEARVWLKSRTRVFLLESAAGFQTHPMEGGSACERSERSYASELPTSQPLHSSSNHTQAYHQMEARNKERNVFRS